MAPIHVRSVDKEWTDDDHDLSLPQFIIHSLRQNRHVERPAQVNVHSGTAMSYQELLLQTVQAAEGWRAMGLKEGDVIALVSRNYHEVFPAVLGAVSAGIQVACLVPSSKVDELRHALSLSQPRVVLTEPELLSAVMVAYPSAQHMIVHGEVPTDLTSPTTIAGLFVKGSHADPDTFEPAALNEDFDEHSSFILYSSGTTGLPKGVMLRDTRFRNPKRRILWNGLDDIQTCLISSPLCWISAVWHVMCAIQFGMTRVFTFKTDEVILIETIDKYKPDVWLAAPTVLVTMASIYREKYCNKYDLSSIRRCIVGGSPMSAEVQEALARDLGFPILQVYASTEGGLVIVADEDDPLGSMGKLAPHVELRLVNPETNEDISAPHTPGELRLKSLAMMKGYISNNKDTDKDFDSLGYLKSGDLVYEDENGVFYFVDRVKEMLKYRNCQIAPAEIEGLLLRHDGVKEACVLGKQVDPAIGDVPMAFVVRSGLEAVTEQELLDLVASKLSDHKRLRGGIVFLDSLPKTLTGKIVRKRLREVLETMPNRIIE